MKTVLKSKKRALLSGVLAIFLLATAGATIALLMHNTQNVENTFQPSEVTCKVVEPGWEDSNKTKKTNVSIKNTGDVDAYIRATVVLNWVDPNNPKNVAPVSVKQNDVIIESVDNSAWILGKDGYFYYPYVIPVGENTGVLIRSLSVSSNAEIPTGYVLSVEIIADAIQAVGTDANGNTPVELAWSKDVVSFAIDENGNRIMDKNGHPVLDIETGIVQ